MDPRARHRRSPRSAEGMTKTQPRAAAAPPRPGQRRHPGIDAIVRADHGDPFAVLGPHVESAQLILRAFLPEARAIAVIDPEGNEAGVLEKVDEAGFWQGVLPAGRVTPPHYRYRVQTLAGTHDFADTYAFPPVLGDLDVHLLAE